METVIDLLKAIQLNMLEAGFAGLLIFSVGYLIGMNKVKKLTHEIYGLQRDVLELNEELLYGYHEDESETPVIGLKPDSLKKTKLAK
jgi:ribosome biogenesis protein Tsr3